MYRKFYAHSLEGKPSSHWQPLEQHLKNVAERAAEFARPFGGDQWAYLAGLWHDLGKYSDAFQAKLYLENGFECHVETRPGRVVHSEAGGHLASLKGWKGADRVLSWLIMGHHAGLTDYPADEIGAKALEPKMRDPKRSAKIIQNVLDWVRKQALPPPPALLQSGADPAFFIRMLFSCLVDADFLDTEAFMDKRRYKKRKEKYLELTELLACFDDHMEKFCESAEPSPINGIRADILRQCRAAAEKPPTVFSLSVPTGGGKTLASLAFALRHAVAHKSSHGKSRIIYVIPYTSIIEQTADVFRNIPGFEYAVIEHHSNVAETEESKETARTRLAAENWDAPLIVTTSVQFFESLFAGRSSRCRKLHNIVNSVVIFDEVQCLPPVYLRPVVFAVRELFRHYRVTPLLCTATQPVLTRTRSFDFHFKEGFDEVTEIIDAPDTLAERLKRVDVVLHRNELQPVDLPELAKALIAEGKSVLCIVNRKNDARKLVALLPEEQTIHLSTNMCAEHRSRTFAQIRSRLKDGGESLLVVSTSLVEAGVDLDFPVVYRALAGIDSLAQAAGRCNREGKLKNGRTVVFIPQNQPGYVRQPAGITRELLQTVASDMLLTPEVYRKYFRQRFWQLGSDVLDRKGIMRLVSGRGMNYYFRTAANLFKIIEDDWQQNVLVPYGEAVALVARLLQEPWNQRALLRRLGRYCVAVPKYLFNALAGHDYVRQTGYPGLFMLDQVLYHRRYGFIPPEEADSADPEMFIVS